MTDQQPEVADITLEAARKQKIHNLKLKTSCLSNEEFIQDLHVSDWSETQKQKLQAAHEKASELLASVESGTKWNLTAAYDIQKLMRVCGLEMSVRELYKPEDKPQFMEIVGLKKTLNELKQHRNKTRIVSFTGTIDNGLTKLEKVEDELRRSQLDATELAQVPVAVLKNLEECMNVTVIQSALMGNEEQVKAQLAAIEKAKEIRNVAIADGEMAIAEEQFYIKAQLHHWPDRRREQDVRQDPRSPEEGVPGDFCDEGCEAAAEAAVRGGPEAPARRDPEGRPRRCRGREAVHGPEGQV
jgi:hypothetical protein